MHKKVTQMTILAINGSPRKNGNTAALLKKAMEGAKEAGAQTEFIQLSDLNFKGCMSCFACKLVAGKHRCVWQDELKPVLEKIEKADGVIFGAPIYFMHISALMAGCLERVVFPYYIYNNERPSVFPGKLPTAFIYTMNAKPEQIAPYKASLNPVERFVQAMFKVKPEILYSYNTWQYPDYSKYEHAIFNVENKKRQKEEVFPHDCAAAYELGKKMGLKKEK